MMHFRGKTALVCLLILTTIIMRASIPEGYMPSARGSGSLFEICPGAVPVGVMQVVAEWNGEGRHAHHAHQGHSPGGDTNHSSHDGKQCPIGHMLASVVAVDMSWEADTLPQAPEFAAAPVIVHLRTIRSAASSRGPPS